MTLCVRLWPRDKLYSQHLNVLWLGATAAVTVFRKKPTTALLLFSCVRFLDIFGQQPSCCSSQVNYILLLHCYFWRMSVNIRWEMLQTSQSCLHQEFLSFPNFHFSLKIFDTES